MEAPAVEHPAGDAACLPNPEAKNAPRPCLSFFSEGGPHAPPNSTLDDASRANMGSQEAQFVKQAEKMIGASQAYVQNTTDPTGDLAGAAGEIAHKDPDTLGAVLATPDLEEALEGADETATWTPDSELPAEWAGAHETGEGKKKITKEMMLGGLLIVGGVSALVGGCLVPVADAPTTRLDSLKSPTGKKMTMGAGALAIGVGALVLWSATANKDKGSALAQGTQDITDPARKKYLSDLNEVATEVSRLHAAREREAGLQLTWCGGLWGQKKAKVEPVLPPPTKAAKEIFSNLKAAKTLDEQLTILDKVIFTTTLKPVTSKSSNYDQILEMIEESSWVTTNTPGKFLLDEINGVEFELKKYGDNDYLLIHSTTGDAFPFTTTKLLTEFIHIDW